jgi:hypothetical protein
MSFAYGCAKDAQENFFSSRRGIWDYEREGMFVLYDNNPTRSKSIRVRAITLVHEALKRNDVKVLGEAYYPIGGQDAGYTWALVVDAHDTGESQLVRLWEEAFCQACAEHDRQSRTSPSVPNPAPAGGGP